MSKSKSKKSGKMGFSALNRILIAQLVIMLGLSLFITKTVSTKTRENAIEHMGAISDERAHIIDNYVDNSEKTLKAFAKASQVVDLLTYSKEIDLGALANGNVNNEDAKKALQRAQKFTEEFGEDIDNLEGLWIGSWDTFVLTQTNPAVVGMQTRPDADKQEALHKGMEDGDDGLYDAGIIISPASGKQCLSMYQSVYDERGNALGFVGLGIYTDDLIETLNSVPIRGVEHSFYSMADVNAGLYIFNADDASKIHTEIDNKKLSEVCTSYKDGKEKSETGYFEYDYKGKTYLSIYTYMPDRGWLVTIDDYKSEVYSLTNTMRIYLGIFGVVILGLILVFNIINKRQQRINQTLLSTIAKNNKTRKSLNTAMYKDVLTGVGNRVSFSMNIEKVKASKQSPVYFALFNISKFSEINAKYGNDAGDRILVRTAEVLTTAYPDKAIYRTGSDEFLVVIPTKDGIPAINDVMNEVNLVFREAIAPEEMDRLGTIYPEFKVSVGRVFGTVDTSVVTKLKAIMNNEGIAAFGMIECTDLDK